MDDKVIVDEYVYKSFDEALDKMKELINEGYVVDMLEDGNGNYIVRVYGDAAE